MGKKLEDYGKRAERARLPIEQKESFCWIESLSEISKKLPKETTGIFIGDRDADIYELFCKDRPSNIDLLIRSSYNRRLKTGSKKLLEVLSELPQKGIMDVTVGRASNRPSRVASCSIRFSQIQLKTKNSIESPTLNVIYVKEENTKNINDPINWRLFTTITIDSLEKAIQCVKWYALRWLIERYHFTLKSGCKIQDLQLEEADRIERAITLYSIIAWRIMFITYIGRTNPNSSCTKVLNAIEWKALCCFTRKSKYPPDAPPTVKEIVLMLAKLGGFLGRNSDKNPGLKVMWQGLSRLNDITESFIIFNDIKI